ncbi:tRNA(Arg) A34 adenosine deaminase TadA [Lentzea xinjiangensis]|uniref:tRNA(Arg) A34 adenosine deaminase TadA n=1 Tax=Lentzea xinjiangensis TaxID=402600 RepID=A0A1H9T6Z6_9PSEU|nr:nucleoside deaminase [Lentzea xinjiangensis]SER92353.1 tRNA(Arg) A34 adenosine deaminase TadA [Lentzea xinjiangensis]
MNAHLLATIDLATRNVASGGGPFGAMVVRAGAVVATGVNQVTQTLDPTAHAEVVAIRAACLALGDFKLTGCTLISSCEPCPLCLSAALWARVDEVVYAADRHDAAAAGFDDREFHELFGKPRDEWDLPVRRISTGEDNAPFTAWLSLPSRIDY